MQNKEAKSIVFSQPGQGFGWWKGEDKVKTSGFPVCAIYVRPVATGILVAEGT